MAQSKTEIFEMLKAQLVELFEVEEDKILPEAELYQDLDIDSIDAIDLILKLKQVTGRKIQPEIFKDVKTVGDVVDAVHALLLEPPQSPEQSKA